jgi:hypothetical protein
MIYIYVIYAYTYIYTYIHYIHIYVYAFTYIYASLPLFSMSSSRPTECSHRTAKRVRAASSFTCNIHNILLYICISISMCIYMPMYIYIYIYVHIAPRSFTYNTWYIAILQVCICILHAISRGIYRHKYVPILISYLIFSLFIVIILLYIHIYIRIYTYMYICIYIIMYISETYTHINILPHFLPLHRHHPARHPHLALSQSSRSNWFMRIDNH